MAKLKSLGKKKPDAAVAAGSNWLALKKTLPSTSKGPSTSKQSSKAQSRLSFASFPRGRVSASPVPNPVAGRSKLVSEEVKSLQDLVLGKGVAAEKLIGEPGRYLAIDCEMVGVGENGSESSLARASIVDFQGRVVLDEFVLQRERVTDYRTQVSGIRPTDMVNAKPFSEVQSLISALLSSQDRILRGFGILNFMLAENPSQGKARAKERKRLVKEELGLDIQTGEHSSVTDARAAMAIYRLHKRAWDASLPASYVKRAKAKSGNEVESGSLATEGDVDQTQGGKAKRKRRNSTGEFPGGGRKGVSSGLGTIVKTRAVHTGKDKSSADQGPKWWQTLGGGGPKGKMTL
ncbi:hypothetical protein OPQ81_010986 [Rhizoctonia solani]|nr:hypothetical protein OPQ81_010986 [Rhizoctonia solani]